MMRSVRMMAVVAGGALLCAHGWARAQDAGIDRLTPLEAGLEDVGPLGRSDRLLPVDLRVPVSFNRVYRLGGEAGLGQAQYFRMDGAVAAVFPRSTYVDETQAGSPPTVPPGTVFRIGVSAGDLLAEAEAGGSGVPAGGISPVSEALRVRGLAPARFGLGAQAGVRRGGVASHGSSPEGSTPRTHPSMWLDESYRSRRVRYLLERAAADS